MNLKEFEVIENLREAIRVVDRNWDTLVEVELIRAKLKRAFFKGCLEAGFDPEQALKLTLTYDPFSGGARSPSS